MANITTLLHDAMFDATKRKWLGELKFQPKKARSFVHRYRLRFATDQGWMNSMCFVVTIVMHHVVSTGLVNRRVIN